jgi:phosphoenolpyruvate synthase/pyruvate phosphate dikinase
MLYLKTLATVTPNELQAVGFRAQDLALLAQNRIETAATFVVLSSAFDELVRTNGLKYKIDYMLSHAQENVQSSLVNAYNGVRKAMLEASFPPGFETELRDLYERITTPAAVGELVASNERPPVRIIMSMNRHDDPENNDTIIQNVSGYDELLVGLREAWALAYHPSQLGSRMREKFPESRMKIALLVQAMEKPFATCHVYSCLPQDHHKLYVQTYAGYPDLREKIAKEFYAVGKEGLRVIATQLGRQQSALEINAAKELTVTPLSVRFELPERDVIEVCRLTKKAERLLQTPVKVTFSVRDDLFEVLWVNRLGFDILIKDEEEVMPKSSGMKDMWQMAKEAVAQAKPTTDDFIAAEEPDQAVPVRPEPPTRSADAPADGTKVAAKLLGASLKIVNQIVEHKYRSLFGETPTENLAQRINRLNDAHAFSRAVDGALLLQAEEAAHNHGHISSMQYAKTIEEVAYLMSYA